MPYISIATNKKLDEAQRLTIKAAMGKLITIIPGKTEPDLMVHIQSEPMFMAGEEAPCAYIDLRVYTKTTEEAKKRFTKETCAWMEKELGIPIDNQYLTIAEYDNWGYGGEWH
jgi:hypothetical protein